MPATVAVYLGDPEIEKATRDRLEQFMLAYVGQWSIGIIGSQTNSIWEMKVEAPDGTGQAVALYGEDRGHEIESILTALENMVENFEPRSAGA
jgi:hypothetical protein